MSRQWFLLMAGRLDAVAVLYRVAATLTAECARSRDHGVLDLPEGYRHCFLEYKRRATTP